jgi:thiol:disulfide interchange protein
LRYSSESEWIVHVVPSTSPARPDRAQVAAFAGIAFGTGEKPQPDSPKPSVPLATPQNAVADDASLLDDFVVAGTSGGYQNTREFLEFVRNAEAGVKPRGMFEGRGPLAILLLVLIGGLALNLTPCVLPMIPINLAIIGAGAQAQSRGRGFLLGTAYGGAMAIVYGVLGLIVILTAGTFGTINSSPWFNLAIAALFVVLGLAMFDVILIDFSRFASGFRTGDDRRGTAAVALAAASCSRSRWARSRRCSPAHVWRRW